MSCFERGIMISVHQALMFFAAVMLMLRSAMADKRSPLVTTTPLTSTQSSPSRPTASAPSPAPTPPPYHIRGRGPLLGVRNVTATSTSTKLCTMINTVSVCMQKLREETYSNRSGPCFRQSRRQMSLQLKHHTHSNEDRYANDIHPEL